MQTLTTTYTIPEGAQGTRATLDVMSQIASEGSRSVVVSQYVNELLLAGETFADCLHMLEYWVRHYYRFEYDPPDVETIKTPDVMLQELDSKGFFTGDCDDVSTLMAAFLLNMRIPCRFVAMKTERGNPEFTHVVVEANCGFYWRRFDMTVEPKVTFRDYGKMTVECSV